MSNTAMLKVEDVPSVLDRLDAAFFDIPFENSDFQNQAFVVAAQQTPARAYRAIGLRMFAKIRAIKEYKINQQRKQIDIEEKEAKIASPCTSEFDRRRLALDILEIREGEKFGEKLLNDALRELNCLHAEFVKYPTYTREQFEAEEFTHFNARMKRQLDAPGPRESLANMLEDLPSMPTRIQGAFAQITHIAEQLTHKE